MSELKQRIQESMKAAMKTKEKDKLAAIRLITAALKQVEVDERIELDDARVLAILDKMLKQRRDSLAEFKKADRQDLAAKESFEIELIQSFLPQQLSIDEVNQLIQQAINAANAQSVRDMGAVMNQLRPKLQGRADMKQVSDLVKSALA